MNIFKLASIFLLKSAGTLEEALEDLEVSDETMEYVLNADKNKISKYIAALEGFPDATPEELEALLYKKEPKQGPSIKNMLQNQLESILNLIRAENNPSKVKDVETIMAMDISEYDKPWILKQILNNYNINNIIDTITYFYKNITYFELKELNQYKTFEELQNLAKEIYNKRLANVRGDGFDRNSTPLIWEDNDYFLFRVETKDACMSLGRGTTWCITMEDEPYYKNDSEENSIFYFLIRKNRKGNEFDKVAYKINRNESNEYKDVEIFDNSQTNKLDLGSLKAEIGNTAIESFNAAKADSANHSRSLMAKIKTEELSPYQFAKDIIEEYYKTGDIDELDLHNILPHVPAEYTSFLFNTIIGDYYDFSSELFRETVNHISTDDADELIDAWDDLDEYDKPGLFLKISPEKVSDLFDEKREEVKNFGAYKHTLKLVFDNMAQEDLSKYMNDKDDNIRELVAKKIDQKYLPQMLNDKANVVVRAVLNRIDQKYLPKILKNYEGNGNMSNIDIIINRIDDKYLDYLLGNYFTNKAARYSLAEKLNPNDERFELFADSIMKPSGDELFAKLVAYKAPEKYLEKLRNSTDPNVAMIAKSRSDAFNN
jgi:hypothetical protein